MITMGFGYSVKNNGGRRTGDSTSHICFSTTFVRDETSGTALTMTRESLRSSLLEALTPSVSSTAKVSEVTVGLQCH